MVLLAETACAVLMAWNSLAAGDVSRNMLADAPNATPIVVSPPSVRATRTDSAADSVGIPAMPRSAGVTFAGRAVDTGLGLLDALPQDTVRKPRRKAVVYSDGYGWRLTLHRRLSWAMLPMFAVSYFSGNELLKAADEGRVAKSWARDIHGPAASGTAILFGANTLTGGLNLWEGRKDANGRVRRIAHSVLFMVAGAGFTYAGVKLADDAEQSQDRRLQHRNVAIGSMGVSTLSWLIMLIGN